MVEVRRLCCLCPRGYRLGSCSGSGDAPRVSLPFAPSPPVPRLGTGGRRAPSLLWKRPERNDCGSGIVKLSHRRTLRLRSYSSTRRFVMEIISAPAPSGYFKTGPPPPARLTIRRGPGASVMLDFSAETVRQALALGLVAIFVGSVRLVDRRYTRSLRFERPTLDPASRAARRPARAPFSAVEVAGTGR